MDEKIFWLWLYEVTIECAELNQGVFYSSRIDGALLPWGIKQ